MKSENKIHIAYFISFVIIIIATINATCGILFSETIYQIEDIIVTQVPNDIATLLFVIPVFIFCLYFNIKGKIFALICWLGILINFAYFYTVSVFDVPFGIILLPNLLIISLSFVACGLIIASVKFDFFKTFYESFVLPKITGSILLALGIFNILHQFGDIISVLVGTNEKTSSSTALLYVDIVFIIPILLSCGLGILKRQAFGYLFGGSILFNYVYMCIALLLFFVIEPFYSSREFNMEGFIIIIVMVILCVLPLYFYLRADLKKR